MLLRRTIEKQAGVIIDVRLDAHTPEAPQNNLSAALTAYKRMGLTINTQKTEIICQMSAGFPHHPTTFTAEGQQLATIPTFKYL
ncbi:hypothetical protein SKAU_G00066370 [Synaphobranchus kaupii]|uniref:Uncharacterized protein n=1 Tax=Synaphobranchus kaupii TaxID=118154 RepID=A0A9Q1G5Z0_SYNKA|nr:hypothetical protein SKAU_G00066370 [Synaphobranchus kaupii]